MRVCLISPETAVSPDVAIAELDVGEHIGLGMVAACLRRAGHEVCCVSCHSAQTAIAELARHVPPSTELVGISVMSQTYPAAIRIAAAARAALGVPVVVGGILPTILGPRFLAEFDPNRDIDFLVRGEGESTAVELAGALASAASPSRLAGVRGLVWRHGDGIQVNRPRPAASDLDALPFPDRDFAEPTIQTLRRMGVQPALRVISSRGCLGACRFCHIHEALTHAGQRPTWRARSPSSMAEEIALLKADFGVTHVLFSDDNFFGYGRLGHERALEFADLLGRKRLGVTFSIQSRVESFDGAVFAALQRVGLLSVDFGIETITPRSLRFLNKHLDLEQVARTVEGLQHMKDLAIGMYFLNIHPLTTVKETALNYSFLKSVGYLDRDGPTRDREVYRKLAASRLEITKHTRMYREVDDLGLLDAPIRGNPVLYDFRFESREMAALYQEMMARAATHGTAGFAAFLDEQLKCRSGSHVAG